MNKDTAIAVYIDNDENCLREIFWLYRSWTYSESNERSDLVIFYNPEVDRSKLPDGSGVFHIPLPPIHETEKLWHDYPRINSTWFLTTDAAKFIHKYKYTLRTDADCFLTPNFKNFRPRLATFGLNVYATYDHNVARRIHDICVKWGIKQYHMNADCHVMAYSRIITEYAKLQYFIAKRLKTEEFKDGPGAWPGWYEYIINMYSAGIAANQFFRMGFNLGGFACMSMCEDPIGTSDYHIHAWHTEQHFSKLKWREGIYDCLDHEALKDDTIANYCIKLAGKRGDL